MKTNEKETVKKAVNDFLVDSNPDKLQAFELSFDDVYETLIKDNTINNKRVYSK